MVERKAYKFRVEPTSEQAHTFECFAGARRFVYNWALTRYRDYYQATGTSVSWTQLSAELTALKYQPGREWLQDIDAQLLQQALADLRRAFINFFEKRAGYPRFKRKKSVRQSFRFPQRVQVKDSKVFVPKIGWVRLRHSQPIAGTLKGATFTQDATGHWYVSLVVEFNLADCPLPKVMQDDVLGVDVGLETFATMSDGTTIENPRFFQQGQRQLRRAQRTLSRRCQGSKRRAKARKTVAKIHHKIAAQRRDFCHQLSHFLVTHYLAVSFETLNINGLAKTKLAKSVLDAAWSDLFRQMRYKGRWSSRHVVFVNRFYPSSQLCGICNYQHKNLALADREWDCPHCGTHHRRDQNAAHNLKRESFRLLVVAGHAKTENARGADVRLGTAEQSATKRESPG